MARPVTSPEPPPSRWPKATYLHEDTKGCTGLGTAPFGSFCSLFSVLWGALGAPFAILCAGDREMEPRIAQDIADFRKLRENGCVYVDKTAILHELVCDPTRSLYFISRPRRFGKSLMLSTLECIFRGQRDLFKGLAIDKLDYDWAEYPILHFSFAGIKIETLEAFKADFRRCVKKVLTEANCKWNEADFPGANFAQAITDLAKQAGNPVVILIDEYDAPVSHALADIKLATAIRSELSDF